MIIIMITRVIMKTIILIIVITVILVVKIMLIMFESNPLKSSCFTAVFLVCLCVRGPAEASAVISVCHSIRQPFMRSYDPGAGGATLPSQAKVENIALLK